MRYIYKNWHTYFFYKIHPLYGFIEHHSSSMKDIMRERGWKWTPRPCLSCISLSIFFLSSEKKKKKIDRPRMDQGLIDVSRNNPTYQVTSCVQQLAELRVLHPLHKVSVCLYRTRPPSSLPLLLASSWQTSSRFNCASWNLLSLSLFLFPHF